jgi:hypothetical protein
MMDIELIRAPSNSFVEMLMSNLCPVDRKLLEGIHWGAVGLVQARLINLYKASDLAEKASNVKTALVFGSCPQHIQMLAIFGKQAAVKTALDKIEEAYRK